MITAEQIKGVNERIKKIEVKGKAYACVPARVQAFREICPEGSIETDVISMADGIVTMKTTVKDETGRVLATGLAQEKEKKGMPMGHQGLCWGQSISGGEGGL